MSTLPSLKEIRTRRRRLGVSQGALARAAGVSQSVVAKIERGRVEPSYRNAALLFQALEALEADRGEDHRVGGLATRGIHEVRPETLLTEAVHALRRHSISQMPVVDGGIVVGSLTDRAVVECLADPSRVTRLARLNVGDVMGDPFPQIPETSPVRLATLLLRHAPAVLVTHRGKVTGIVTQSDLFKAL